MQAEDIARARKDAAAREKLIEDNRAFLLSSAGKALGHYVTEHDDAYSVAMIAFNEAIDAYSSEKGSFPGFAYLVIRRRLLDQLRREKVWASREISVSFTAIEGDAEEEEGADALSLAVKRQVAEESKAYAKSREHTAAEEIAEVQKLLSAYGFSFFDLADCSPKAGKTKEGCARVVAALLADEELFRRMRKQKALPGKELEERAKVPKKLLERHRKYLIAAAEILNGEYPLLAAYMDYIRKSLGG